MTESHRSLRQLSWRFWRKSSSIQLGITMLFICASIILMVYGAYIERERQVLGTRIISQLPDNFLVVHVKDPMPGPIVTSTTGPGPRSAVTGETPDAAWTNSVLSSNKGNLPFSLVTVDKMRRLNSGEVLLTEGLAYELQLSQGDTLTVPGLGELQVVGTHDGTLFGHRLVAQAPEGTLSHFFQYSLFPSRMQWKTHTVTALRDLYRRHGSTVYHSESEHSLSQRIMAGTFSPGARARMEFILFNTIAFLSIRMFVYLDRRKTYAIIKSLGLKARELWGMLVTETFVSPLVGVVLGTAIGLGALTWLGQSDAHISPSLNIALAALGFLLPVMLVGLLLPGRFLTQAGVNQLMFERPVPLICRRVQQPRARLLGFEPVLERGAKAVKLDITEGQFSGFVFAKVGKEVKEGEVVARLESWWGMVVTEYLAPATGKIVITCMQSGVVVVAPENEEYEPILQIATTYAGGA